LKGPDRDNTVAYSESEEDKKFDNIGPRLGQLRVTAKFIVYPF
jgi:hypothetical protein